MSEQAVAERVLYAETRRGLYFTANTMARPIMDTIWGSVDWEESELYSRAVFPYLDCQHVWITRMSDGLRVWWRDEAHQARFFGQSGTTETQQTAVRNISAMTPMTPIESAIESYLYGPASLLRDDETSSEEE